METDSLALRIALEALAKGNLSNAETEPTARNAFALRVDPAGPIFTVTITYGGSLRSNGGQS
jgi:hypothetical protein